MKDKIGLYGRLALFAAAMIWGSSFVVLKNTLDSVPTLWVLAIRFTVSAGILALAAGKKLRRMEGVTVKGGLLMGLCLAGAYIFQTYGLVYTTPGKNAFLTTVYCVLVPFMAWGIYRRKPQMFHIFAAFLCITGIGFVSLDGSLSGINRGDLLTLVCGIFYALQIIVMEQYVPSGDTTSISAVEFAVAAVLCWAGALLFEKPPAYVPVSAWVSIGYLSVMCTALCFFLQAWGLRYTPSATAAVLMSLECVFGTLCSVLFYHECVTPRLLTGFALIFTAVLISELKPKLPSRRHASST